VATKFNIEYSWDQKLLGGHETLYVSEAASSTPVTVSAELGYSKGAMAPHGPYLDWSLAASFPLAHCLSASLMSTPMSVAWRRRGRASSPG
jgi:hypothetical protein